MFHPNEGFLSGVFFEVPAAFEKWHQVGRRLGFEPEDVFDWMVIDSEGQMKVALPLESREVDWQVTKKRENMMNTLGLSIISPCSYKGQKNHLTICRALPVGPVREALCMRVKYEKSIIITFSFIASCANPINLHTANEYFQGGLSNAAQGKWFNARMAFGRAWANADLGKAEDRVTAVYAYEYGRASGVICDWVESEKGLLKALELDRKANGPVHMSLVELARMYQAKDSLEESEKYYFMAKEILDDMQADTKDSIGYANILKAYAEVLSGLGKNSEAETLIKREQEIRSVFKDRKSGHDVTPYGEHCDQKSLTKTSTQADAKDSPAG